MKKKLLLINKSGLSAPFEKALKEEGFEVISFFNAGFKNFEKSFFQKITNIFRRNFLKDKTYLQRQETNFIENGYTKRSKELKVQNFDFALFFRADLFPEEVIKNIRNAAEIMISDQYDGMEVGKKILDYQGYFDSIFVFDPDDYKNYREIGFLPITNCWFPDAGKLKSIEQDFFYVGVGTDNRKEKILNFQKSIMEDYSLKAVLTVPPFREEKTESGIKFQHKGLSYEENMRELKASKCLLDFKLNHHNGLSFRFFEAMYYGKKIITDNATVVHYDFYNPNNIFVMDYENYDGLQDFMNRPYQTIRPHIIEKYGFKNWIRYVLTIQPHTEITLPEC